VWALHGVVPHDLQLGFFYLCALPSTVSSSVALTVAARGSVPVAVFNATLSSLLGVVATPLWMGWMLGQAGIAFPIGPVMRDLLLWVLLPLLAGQVARPLLGAWAARHKARLQWVDRGTILLLIYTSFADSVVQGVWSRFGWLTLAGTLLGALVLFGLVFWCVRGLARVIGLSEGDRVAAIFCGSKKTLATGVPMAQMIFGANPALGLILMPLMLYHPLQLAIGGVLAQRWAGARGGTAAS
jgi:sodium/bile acid cotransporter 7